MLLSCMGMESCQVCGALASHIKAVDKTTVLCVRLYSLSHTYVIIVLLKQNLSAHHSYYMSRV